jgi:hypothetical protein
VLSVAQLRVEPSDAGVAVLRALLARAVDGLDGVVHIEEHLTARAGQQPRHLLREVDQEPGGDRVELADVPEGERAQEHPDRRRRPHPAEQVSHAPVAQQIEVVDAVRAGEHPAHQRGQLRPRRAGSPGNREPLLGQPAQPGPFGQRQRGHQPAGGDQVRLVEHHRQRRRGVGELHLGDAPSWQANRTLDKSHSSCSEGHFHAHHTRLEPLTPVD